MAYVVAGTSGNTGRVVAETLLAAGKKVRVLVRDAAKGEAWRARGAEVAVATLQDSAALARAFEGAEGAYLLVPPTPGVADARAEARTIIASVKAALETTPVPHVVWLSSVAAHHPSGTGPIRNAYEAETQLGNGKTPFTFVRAAYFLENWGSVAGLAKSSGILPSFLTAGRAVSQVATEDIGRVAAEALLAGPGVGNTQERQSHRVISLEGPARYTPEEVAAAFSKVLGKPVQLISAPEEAIVPTLLEAGFTQDLAGLFAEMIHGINTGHVDFDGAPEAIVRGRVPLEAVVQKLVG